MQKKKIGVINTLMGNWRRIPPPSFFLSLYIPLRLKILNEQLNKRYVVQNQIF